MPIFVPCLSHTERSQRWYVSHKCSFCRFCFQWDDLISEAALHFYLVKIVLVLKMIQPFCLVKLRLNLDFCGFCFLQDLTFDAV